MRMSFEHQLWKRVCVHMDVKFKSLVKGPVYGSQREG